MAAGRETKNANLVGADPKLLCARANKADGSLRVLKRDSVLGQTLATGDTVLGKKSGDALLVQPLGNLGSFMLGGENPVAATRKNDHGAPVLFRWLPEMESRFRDVLDSQDIVALENWSKTRAAEVRQNLRTAFTATDAWGAAAVIATARDNLPRDTRASVDTGAHRILFDQMWQAYEPRDVMQSTGLGTMGCALPLAIGRKMAEPDKPMAAFMGDACMEMVAGELATARDHKLPIILFVFVDESLALIELKQRAMQLPNHGVDFAPTDFVAVAKAFGGNGVSASSRDELAVAIKDALAEDQKFTLIACPIPRQNYDGQI